MLQKLYFIYTIFMTLITEGMAAEHSALHGRNTFHLKMFIYLKLSFIGIGLNGFIYIYMYVYVNTHTYSIYFHIYIHIIDIIYKYLKCINVKYFA